MSRLVSFVYLTDENGEVHGFGPNSVVPDWARAQITNPHAWESTDGADGESPEPPAVQTTEGGSTSFGSHLTAGGGVVDDGPPPQGGPGASRQKWVDYATAKGVEVEADWKREDIIAACEKAGVPV